MEQFISVKLKQSKGFGFIEFGSDNEARKAISELNGKSLLGKTLRVSGAIQQQPRTVFQETKGSFGRDKNLKKAW